MIHYHGTPIAPIGVLRGLAGCHFCISFAAPRNLDICHQIGQSLMLDNGAFTIWKQGGELDLRSYYTWVEESCWPVDWAVIPDVIDGGTRKNNILLRQWPHGHLGAPVWHLDEPLNRLAHLIDVWPKVCLGSAGMYAQTWTDNWKRRMDEVFSYICRGTGRVPIWIHGLRMMRCSGHRWPLSSVDSADIARNHNTHRGGALKMVSRWDVTQCGVNWK